MVDDSGSRTRRRLAGVAAAVFATAFTTMLAAQLALMSVLDTARAERVAAEVASSAFVTGVLDDAIRLAVTPVTGPEIASVVAVSTSSDPRVRSVVEGSLVSAHRQIVDPSAPAGIGGPQVDSVVADVLEETGARLGVDLGGVSGQLAIPDARPARTPTVGLGSLATTTRLITAVVAVLAALAATAVHPRPARGLAGLGARAAIVCGTWAVGLLVVGWLIGRVAETLFGELLDAVWASAAPAMLGVVMAGVLLGLGVWLGGRALDGLVASRRRPGPAGPPGPTHL